jgi:succinoglycan biosynthesis protein ExoV
VPLTIHYFRSDPPNFGDELNTLVWPALIPELETTAVDGVLVGIGTILDWRIPQDGNVFVIGPGAGLTSLPSDLKSERFQVLAIRGPLTTKLAGLPPELAVTDPALLLRAIYPQLLNPWNRGTKGKTLFVPHFTTAMDPGWRRACALAGVEFVDPTQDCRTILKKIASARLVIAEAMHAAIVADAFRVPWIPVASTPHFSTFKWVDWALSLHVPFKPTILPAVSTRHGIQRIWMRLFVERCLVADFSMESDADMRSEALDALLSQTAQNTRVPGSGVPMWIRMKAAAFYKYVLDPLLARFSGSLFRALDVRTEKRVSRILSALAATPGYLSAEEISAARLKTLLQRVEMLRNRIATPAARPAQISKFGRTRTKFE